VRIKFEPRDLWIGVYWCDAGRNSAPGYIRRYWKIYVCIVPCFPIIFEFHRDTESDTHPRDIGP